MTSDTPLKEIFRLNPLQQKALERLGLKTARDLLYYFPSRYEVPGERKNIADLEAGDDVVIFGKVLSAKTSKAWRKKIPMGEAVIEDETGKIKAIWFHQPYLAKKVAVGQFAEFRGKVTARKKAAGAATETAPELYLTNPEMRDNLVWQAGKESLFYDGENERTLEEFLIPVYPETRGLSSGWFYYHQKKLISNNVLDDLNDPLPPELLKKFNLPSLKTALVWIHHPKKPTDAEAARKRFAFEEVFFIQLARLRDKKIYQSNSSFSLEVKKTEVGKFLKNFPFKPTTAQTKAIEQILADFAGDKPMIRLLEGDVGSGKTLVAAAATFAVTKAGYEVSYMAPTEILARQHFESFCQYFAYLNVQVGLLTGKECRKFPSKIDPTESTHISRTQLLKWVANGEIPILVGTHALIQKNVKFKNLAFAIIDEQHRFGVMQRAKLVRRSTPNERGTNAEKESGHLIFSDLTYKVREVLFSVKKELGSGHKEIIYQKAIEEELKRKNIEFEREKILPVYFHDKKIGTYRPDFVIENKIILELKTLAFIGNNEKRQLWHYLKNSEYQLALLANYGPNGLTIERIVYNEARKQEPSAFVPHSSALSLRQSASNQHQVVPHLLSMTATPIPRTLALTIYGDLDLTLLDELPAGRKPIVTKIISPDKREEAYEHIRQELKAGRQAYVICPRIDPPTEDGSRAGEPDSYQKFLALQTKSATAEAKRLQEKVFPEFEVGLMHSKLKPSDKEETMEEFTDGELDILVSTSVVEVGVNVPNATIIIIEGAERFGLAQLHQLRGRVLRSSHQAYCYIFSDTKSAKSMERLKALVETKSGFELAEKDLALRGAGTMAGEKQWGISDLGMEALRNLKMVAAARTEAEAIIESDPDLSFHPEFAERLGARKQELHFE